MLWILLALSCNLYHAIDYNAIKALHICTKKLRAKNLKNMSRLKNTIKMKPKQVFRSDEIDNSNRETFKQPNMLN
jgi:hypothetical protein